MVIGKKQPVTTGEGMVAESPNSSTLNGSLSYLLSKMSGSSLSPEVSLGLANQRFIMYF